MRIVYAALRHDYGDPRRGASFEEQAFFDTLTHSEHEVIPFDFFGELLAVGYEEMNRRLLRCVRELEPDLLFCVLFEDQLDPRVISVITRKTKTTTFNWFCDDHWRFDGYSRHWAPHFDWIATTDEKAYERFHELGMTHALMTQWACNPRIFRPHHGEPLGVTFVGQPHGDRRRVIRRLERAGVDVECWGHGWPKGRLTVDEMASVFSRSRINLNFAGASGARRLRSRTLQLKARPFEIAGCGGFVLTQHTPGLDRYFDVEAEIATFRRGSDLVRQVQRLVDDEERRGAMSRRAHERVLREHTYEHRFAHLFTSMGLAEAVEVPAA